MRRAGIYRITMKTSSGYMVYVGQSVDIAKRFNHHRHQLRADRHSNPILQNVYNSYGFDVFTFDMVLACEPVADTLRLYEQAVLDFYVKTRGSRQVANICVAQVSNRLGVKARMETRAKMADRNRGKKHSPETIQKIKESKRGRGPPREHIEMLARLNRGRKRSIEAIEKTASANRGRSLSPDAIRKRQETRKANAEKRGYWCSPAWIEKQRARFVGAPHG